MSRTRIKFCGLTRSEDIHAAVAAGADAIGFVFYKKSARYVSPEQAATLITAIPAFVSTVGLFVNCSVEEIVATVAQAPIASLQFHGDETPEQCARAATQVNLPYLVALRVRPETLATDLLEYERRCRAASNLFTGLLLDTFVDGYGGGGRVFDWATITKELAPRIVLSGGLRIENAFEAVTKVRPYAVDVSSGIESVVGSTSGPGIKDAQLMAAFAAAIRAADNAQSSL
jgi:phosphoribosylanthranilate isomerase